MGQEQQLRECKLGVVIGRKRVGKTYTTDILMKAYVAGNPAKGINPRKVLILDANDEFTHVKAIAITDLVQFTAQPWVEMRRIRPIHMDGRRFSLNDLSDTLNIILGIFRGGLLLIEDINLYVGDTMKKDVLGAICTNAHKDLDIILHYQGIGRIGTKVWQNITWLRFHKISDDTVRHKNKFEENFELYRLVELMVNHKYDNGDIRFYQYVNCEDRKLDGKIDKELFKIACEQYIEENYRKLVRPLLGIGLGDRKKYTEESAYKHVMERLEKEYLPQKK